MIMALLFELTLKNSYIFETVVHTDMTRSHNPIE